MMYTILVRKVSRDTVSIYSFTTVSAQWDIQQLYYIYLASSTCL